MNSQLCLFCNGIGSVSIDDYPKASFQADCFICHGTGHIRVNMTDEELDNPASIR